VASLCGGAYRHNTSRLHGVARRSRQFALALVATRRSQRSTAGWAAAQLDGPPGTLSVTVPIARWTHAVATRALAVPPAWGARWVVSRPTVHTALARPTLAMPRCALPAEPTVRPWRQLCAARRRQQHDQSSSQNETLHHRSSRNAIRSPRCSAGPASVRSSSVPVKRNVTSRCRSSRPLEEQRQFGLPLLACGPLAVNL
jgi:hypothetical protein